MPFDGAGFPPRQPAPRRAGPSDNVVSALIILLTAVLLVAPLSLAAYVDIVRYFRGS